MLLKPIILANTGNPRTHLYRIFELSWPANGKW